MTTKTNFVSYMKPNHIYNVSVNENGQPTLFTVVGVNDNVDPIELQHIEKEDVANAIDACLASVKNGTMVMAITSEDKVNIKVTSELGVGYIIYAKPVLMTSGSLEEVLNFLKEKSADKDFGVALRYKRRQNKWFVHAGVYSKTLPKSYKPSTENVFRLYDMSTRSHSLEGGDVE